MSAGAYVQDYFIVLNDLPTDGNRICNCSCLCILHVSYLAHVWRNKYGDSAKRVITICGVRKCQRNINRLIGYLARVGCIKTQKHPSDADSTYKYLLVDCGFCSRNEKMADLVQIYCRGLSRRK